MPTHERKLLRDAIVAQVKGTAPTFRTAAGARVVSSRHAPNKTDTLPKISVFTADEPVNESSAGTSPRELKRTVRVEVVGWVVASEDVDDALDALALEIETAMDLDTHLDGYAFDSILEATAFGEKLEGERPLGAVSLTYACTYHTQKRIPLPTEDFEIASSQISIGNGQALADRAKDDVDIPII